MKTKAQSFPSINPLWPDFWTPFVWNDPPTCLQKQTLNTQWICSRNSTRSPAKLDYSYCTSLFHRLGAGGRFPFVGALGGGPLDEGLEFEPSDGCGAGLIGRFITFWPVLLDVRTGYDGRGGADPWPFEGCCGLMSLESLLVGGDRSRSFSLMVADGAAGARCDLRLLCSIMLTAHASRSTGVRLAACKKAS